MRRMGGVQYFQNEQQKDQIFHIAQKYRINNLRLTGRSGATGSI